MTKIDFGHEILEHKDALVIAGGQQFTLANT